MPAGSFKKFYHKPRSPCCLVYVDAVESGCRDPQRLESLPVDFGFVGNVPPVAMDAVELFRPVLDKEAQRSAIRINSASHDFCWKRARFPVGLPIEHPNLYGGSPSFMKYC